MAKPRFHHVPRHSFCDQRRKVVSLIHLASLRDYEAQRVAGTGAGSAPMSGSAAHAAWSERGWVGQQLQVGGAVLRVDQGDHPLCGDRGEPRDGATRRRSAGGTAASGRPRRTGRACRGSGGGRFAVGDAIEVLPE